MGSWLESRSDRTPGGMVFTVVFGTVGIIVTGFVLGVCTSAIDATLERLHFCLLSKWHKRKVILMWRNDLAN